MSFLQKVRQEPVNFMVRKMWAFSDDLKLQILLMWALGIMGRIIWLLPPFIFGVLLNEIQKNGVSNENITFVLLVVVCIFLSEVGGWVFHGPSRIIERSIGYKIDRNYKKYLYNAVLSLPLTWHSDHDSGDTIDKINKATESVFRFSRSTFMITGVIVNIIGTTYVLAFFDPKIALFAILSLSIAIYILIKFDKKLIPQYKEINNYDNKASAKIFDSLSNVTSVKVLSIENSVLSGVKKAWWLSYPLYMKNKILVEWKWFTGGMTIDFLIILPILFYIYNTYISGGEILVGTLSSMYMYLKNFNSVYDTIAGEYDDIAIQKASILGVNEIEDDYEKLVSKKKKNLHEWEKIDFENINFSYNNSDPNLPVTLKNLDLSILSGSKIAIIGESGGGKSTLLKVIHGMYENTYSNIVYENEYKKVSLKDCDLSKIDIASTLVPQEPEVFSASIRENLTLLLDFTDSEIKKATDMAMFSDVIENLPKKIDSVVNEKGVNLSGGQKQRLALARALLFSKGKKLILLDESTSSVDPLNEGRIYQNIFEHFKDATILASIHKMNLLKYFDRILVMKGGKIVDDGSFEELLSRNEVFKKSWDEYINNDYSTQNIVLDTI